MAGLAEYFSVNLFVERPLHSETCRRATETLNVS